jgi:hypothetical protein
MIKAGAAAEHFVEGLAEVAEAGIADFEAGLGDVAFADYVPFWAWWPTPVPRTHTRSIWKFFAGTVGRNLAGTARKSDALRRITNRRPQCFQVVA